MLNKVKHLGIAREILRYERHRSSFNLRQSIRTKNVLSCC